MDRRCKPGSTLILRRKVLLVRFDQGKEGRKEGRKEAPGETGEASTGWLSYSRAQGGIRIAQESPGCPA